PAPNGQSDSAVAAAHRTQSRAIDKFANRVTKFLPAGWKGDSMMRTGDLFRAAIVCLGTLLTLNAPRIWAQSSTSGSVSGQVMDRHDAVIVGAEVVLTDTSTNTAQTTQTNEVGRYIFVNVPPGTYNLTVSHGGFNQAKVLGQTVQVGLVLTLNVALDVGSTTTTIEVQAAAGAELQTSNATVGTTISGAPLNALPNLGRDANSFF